MENINWIKNKADISFSTEVMDELSKITDNKDCGGRSAGSPAEHRAADYLAEKFRQAGLVNVTKDPCSVDRWVFEEARLKYRGTDGERKEVILGGYACNANCKNREFPLVYAGRGTETDLRRIDVKGKLVLIDINQAEEWWINFPAYEASLSGAAGVICINVGGFGQEGDNVLVSEDICGPADLMVFSIGKRDGADLKEIMKRSESAEMKVVLSARSKVSGGGVSYNVWGDIPGKTDDVIYVINHYDSYYFTVFDDVQGIGWALGLAKLFTENGYVPDRTIRFVAHGAEEWGLTDCKYDWAVGAYKQITQVRPEWRNNGFAVVNLDGFYAVKGEERFCIVCTKELYDFVKESVSDFGDTKNYTIEVNMKLTSATEDFSYTKAGMPSLVAGAYDGCLADRKVLHSSDSGWDSGFDFEAFEMFHRLFAHIIVSLDRTKISPVNLKRRIYDAYESVKVYLNEEEKTAFVDTIGLLGSLSDKIKDVNKKMSGFISGSAEHDLHDLYRLIHKNFIRLNWNDEMIAPHERYISNIESLKIASDLMDKKKYEEAAKVLSEVDFNYYAEFFSERTYTFFEEQVTKRAKPSWGAGLVDNGNENLYKVIRALLKGVCTDAETEAVREAERRQRKYLKDAILAELNVLKVVKKDAGSLLGKL